MQFADEIIHTVYELDAIDFHQGLLTYSRGNYRKDLETPSGCNSIGGRVFQIHSKIEGRGNEILAENHAELRMCVQNWHESMPSSELGPEVLDISMTDSQANTGFDRNFTLGMMTVLTAQT
ncbi:hypothetical protein BDR07DRAFT_1389488 [Suillus spraguei]|nr:hypothetical protein BDR07DRAFT_1389488 [Suillus spraguei]